MDELSYKDLTKKELDLLKDEYINSRINSMSENDLKLFTRQVIEDQIKGTVGNAEEKEAWEEIKEHFSNNLGNKILQIKAITSKNNKLELKTPEETEFDKRLSLLKRQQEEKQSIDMWDDE